MRKSLLAKFMSMILTFVMIVTIVPSAAVTALAAETVYYGIYTGAVTWTQLYGNDNFDVITSATTNFAGRIANCVSEPTEDGNGTNYTGVKNVPVAIDANAYNALSEEQKALITLNEDQTKAPAWYLTMSENGAFDGNGITTTDVTKVKATAEIEAPSAWGDYCVLAKEEEQKYLPDPSDRNSKALIGFDNLIGGTFTAVKDGVEKTYTLGYMENLWTRTHEFSFRIAEDSPMVKMGNSTNYKQFADIPGSVITSFTYYTTDGAYEFDLTSSNVKVKNQLPASAEITGDKEAVIASDGSLSVKIDASNLPEGFALQSVGRSMGHGNTIAKEGTYTYENGVLTISADEVAEIGGAGNYEVVFVDSTNTYVNAEYAFTVSAADQEITGVSDSYTKTYGDKAFSLGAKAKTELSYASDNTKVATVDESGNVTIKGAGTADITMTAAASSVYKEAVKTVTVTVNKAASTVTIKSSVKYTGKAVSGLATVKGSKGKVTYTYYSDSKGKKKISAPKSVGTYYVKAVVAADANYKGVTSKITKFSITKASPTIKVKTTSKSYKAATVKKASQTFSIGASVNSKGKLSYSKASKSSNKLSVNKSTGKVTIKKGTKKGTYKINVKISAKAKGNYNAGSKTVTIKVVVK
ncbi:MAG: hypothetical protein Q4E73_00165 [Lachnospiraceae bacterium]|nr:hypothetical protein [Lachnospiraceae bacterium]